ncbi:Zn-dependent protease with chaperone function [Idiomarina sp. A28L]|uniref:protease HtpX n=1 Tax=Idiomarina sp. A28L TaxID=1036674 RepID=UPI0002138A0F|nr:protease HtpX [Idiomarina sp. A28L]EGN75838.1 Zn-dependent protease with chaperone function [Idiomarina sp. A28L]
MKRIILFLATNIAVLIVLSIVMNILMAVFGVDFGSYTGLLIFAAIFGFGGAFISLFISKWMAKRSTGAKVIEQPRNDAERWLLETVRKQAQQAGIGMPEVAIYDSPEANAFATGASKNNSLVAVSTGLLRSMSKDEVEAVLAHEVSHIANGDMVTLTLIQGVVNTFVIFLARVIAGLINSALRGNQQGGSHHGGGGFAYFGLVILFEILFGALASLIVFYFSRQREYRADAGAASLVGPSKMIAALQRLSQGKESQLDDKMLAFGIKGKLAKGELMMTHPPIEKRIAALRNRSFQ